MRAEYTRLLGLIEGEIGKVLPSRPDAAWFSRFFGELPALPGEEIVAALNAPAIELVRRGGKRWRPLLFCLSARAFGRGDGAVELSPLVELAHNGSLIVDDIEDGSEKRRGGPAIHLIYGVDAAVNDGNLLYFLPLALIDGFDAPPGTRLALHARYALHLRRLHLGQAMDIEWHRRNDFIPDEASYLTMCSLKTGVLSRAAAELGAIAAGAGEAGRAYVGSERDAGAQGARRIEAIGMVFESLGVAFQILDDAKNLREGLPGKARGDDIVEGKKSLPVIIACRKEPKLIPELSRCFARAKEGGIGALEVEEAIGMMERIGAVDEALSRARGMLADSRSRLAAALPAGPGLDELDGIFALLDS
jgi:octaprenyl-diphosphate synthase